MIKKIIVILIIMLMPSSYIKADEYKDVTKEVEIRYRWYKETILNEGEYVPLKDIKKEDVIDKKKIKYVSNNNEYTEENCKLSPEYYLLNTKIYREYYKVHNIRYVLIENIDLSAKVEIYYGNSTSTFSVMNKENNKIYIDLKTARIPDKLLFYIDGDTSYTISLYTDPNFNNKMLSKTTTYKKILTPDGSWIIPETNFITYNTYLYYEENELTTLKKEYVTCSYQEKYVYKYNKVKEYYDNEYYTNVEGYIKDLEDYKIFYQEKPITNTVEVIQEKIVSVPKIEYITIEKNNEIDSSKEEIQCQENTIVKTKKEIIEKEIIKIPKKIYIVIIVLTIIVTLLFINNIRNMSNKKNKKYCRKDTKR